MANHMASVADRELEERLEQFHALPLLKEDDREVEMGESNLHALAEHILRYALAAHLGPQSSYRVFSNLNLHYMPRFPSIFVSPDTMVVAPAVPLGEDVTSYFVGRDGPAPVLVGEVLSPRTAQEGDLGTKLYVYSMLGVPEYILVDESGRYLPQRLLLKRLQPDRSWEDEQDPDGGVTSRLGFRVIFDSDGRLRVLDGATGRRYVRPDEAEARVRELEAEIARLKAALPRQPNP